MDIILGPTLLLLLIMGDITEILLLVVYLVSRKLPKQNYAVYFGVSALAFIPAIVFVVYEAENRYALIHCSPYILISVGLFIFFTAVFIRGLSKNDK